MRPCPHQPGLQWCLLLTKQAPGSKWQGPGHQSVLGSHRQPPRCLLPFFQLPGSFQIFVPRHSLSPWRRPLPSSPLGSLPVVPPAPFSCLEPTHPLWRASVEASCSPARIGQKLGMLSLVGSGPALPTRPGGWGGPTPPPRARPGAGPRPRPPLLSLHRARPLCVLVSSPAQQQPKLPGPPAGSGAGRGATQGLREPRASPARPSAKVIKGTSRVGLAWLTSRVVTCHCSLGKRQSCGSVPELTGPAAHGGRCGRSFL